jgi:hypothetical protein
VVVVFLRAPLWYGQRRGPGGCSDDGDVARNSLTHLRNTPKHVVQHGVAHSVGGYG